MSRGYQRAPTRGELEYLLLLQTLFQLLLTTLRPDLEETHEVTFRVSEHRDCGPFWHFCGSHHRAASETLDLPERLLQVGNLDVEGNVALTALHSCPNTAVDAVLTAWVCHRVARHRRLHLPVKDLLVEALKSFSVPADHLEMHNRIAHLLLLSVLLLYGCATPKSNA